MLPVVTVLGMEFAALLSGLVVVEQFNLNGIGKWFVLAIDNHDFTVTQTLVLLFAAIFIITNFVVISLCVADHASLQLNGVTMTTPEMTTTEDWSRFRRHPPSRPSFNFIRVKRLGAFEQHRPGYDLHGCFADVVSPHDPLENTI